MAQVPLSTAAHASAIRGGETLACSVLHQAPPAPALPPARLPIQGRRPRGLNHAVRSGGETKITPSPRTNSMSICRLDVLMISSYVSSSISIVACMHGATAENQTSTRCAACNQGEPSRAQGVSAHAVSHAGHGHHEA
eukprot:scaffold3723_cov112-Isochrysis_galbana.AAC.9